MTDAEKQMLDMHFKELTKHEVAFLEGEGEGEKNEHGTYIYISHNKNHSIRLDLFLQHYKQYLIDHNIVKEI